MDIMTLRTVKIVVKTYSGETITEPYKIYLTITITN